MIAFQQIAQRIEQALAGAAVADSVMRGRLRPVPEETLTAVVVRYDRSSGEGAAVIGGMTDWDTAIAIDCYQRVDGVDDPDEACGELLGRVYAVVQGLDTSGLAVMGLLLNPEIVATPSEVDPSLTCLTLYLTVQHRTDSTTLIPQE